jgi:hypothetical protein
VKDANLPPTANPAMVPTWDGLEDEDEKGWVDEEKAADDVLVVEEVTVMEATLVVDRGAVDSGLSAVGHG